MSEYYKINSLWKRQGWYFDQDKKKSSFYPNVLKSLIIGDYADEEFGNIKKWDVSEKIDGTNIRIEYERDKSFRIAGRTDNAQIAPHLLTYLQTVFTLEKIESVFKDAQKVTLFGEGYGPKIQAGGGNYRKHPGFIMFDVVVGNWVLQSQDMRAIASEISVPAVPHIGIMTEDEIVDFVKSKPLSRCSEIPQMMEGVVARSAPLMLFRNGRPIMFKLKCKEFQ